MRLLPGGAGQVGQEVRALTLASKAELVAPSRSLIKLQMQLRSPGSSAQSDGMR